MTFSVASFLTASQRCYTRWIQLAVAVYSISVIPFEPRALDTLWIAGIALAVSLIATIYPACSAPDVALR